MPGHGGMDYDSGGTGSASSGSYTDEEAQDAVGTILRSTTSIQFVYTDATPLIEAHAIGIASGAVVGFDEAAQDAVGGIVQSSTTITAVYTDATPSLVFHVPNFTSGAWTAFTPTLSGGWAIGNATHTSAYARIGRMVFFYTVITTGTTTSYGNPLTIALPVTAATNAPVIGMTVQLVDTGTNTFYGVIHSNTTTTITIRVPKVGTTYLIADNVSATIPHSWTTGDQVVVTGMYEAAA